MSETAGGAPEIGMYAASLLRARAESMEAEIVEAMFNARPLPPMRAPKEHYRRAWRVALDLLIGENL